MMKKLLFITLLSFIYCCLSAQIGSENKALHKIDINFGIAGTTFFEKQPLDIVLCSTASCNTAIQQRGLPTFTFGGSIAKLISNRHYLGVAYQWSQIKFDQGFEVHYQEELVDQPFYSTYHNYSIHHQMILKEDRITLNWNNDAGLQKLNGGRNIFKQPLFFYRTGLDIGKSWERVGIYATPFVQFDFDKHVLDEGRPINYGVQAKVTIRY